MYIYYVVVNGYMLGNRFDYGAQVELDHEIKTIDDITYLSEWFYKKHHMECATVLNWKLLEKRG